MLGTIIDRESSPEGIVSLTELRDEVEKTGAKFIGGYESDHGHVVILRKKAGGMVMAFVGEPTNPHFKTFWEKWEIQTGTQVRLIHDKSHIEEICQ